MEKTIDTPDMKYHVGGHSKGGHLAVYVSMLCPKDKQNQIIEIYSNDGPGMCDSIVNMDKYENISGKVIRIVPEFCVIGSLFSHEREDKILLESGRIHRISDFSKSGIEEIESVLIAITQTGGKTKLVIGKFAASLFHAFRNIDYKTLFKTKTTIQGTVYFIIGLIFILLPEMAAKFVEWGLGIFSLLLLGKRLLANAFSNEADTVRSKYKVIFYMIAMCGLSFLLAKTSLVQRFTDLIIGAFFMLSAYRQIRNTITLQMKLYQKVLTTISVSLLFLLELVPIISIKFEFVKYAVIAGICSLVFGTWKIVYFMYKNGNSIEQ